MKEQILITIGREFGSAGHEIGENVAKKLGIGFYDRAMLDELATSLNIDKKIIEKYDEKRNPRKAMFLQRQMKVNHLCLWVFAVKLYLRTDPAMSHYLFWVQRKKK